MFENSWRKNRNQFFERCEMAGSCGWQYIAYGAEIYYTPGYCSRSWKLIPTLNNVYTLLSLYEYAPYREDKGLRVTFWMLTLHPSLPLHWTLRTLKIMNACRADCYKDYYTQVNSSHVLKPKLRRSLHKFMTPAGTRSGSRDSKWYTNWI